MVQSLTCTGRCLQGGYDLNITTLKRGSVAFALALGLMLCCSVIAGCSGPSGSDAKAYVPKDIPLENTVVETDATAQFGSLRIPISSSWRHEEADKMKADAVEHYLVDEDKAVRITLTRVLIDNAPSHDEYDNYEAMAKTMQDLFSTQNIQVSLEESSVAGHVAVKCLFEGEGYENIISENHQYVFMNSEGLYQITFGKSAGSGYDLSVLENAVIPAIAEGSAL